MDPLDRFEQETQEAIEKLKSTMESIEKDIADRQLGHACHLVEFDLIPETLHFKKYLGLLHITTRALRIGADDDD